MIKNKIPFKVLIKFNKKFKFRIKSTLVNVKRYGDSIKGELFYESLQRNNFTVPEFARVKENLLYFKIIIILLSS